MSAWVVIRIRRWSKRSATRPVIGSSTTCGPNWSAITRPTATASLSVSTVSTSQSWAVRCIHVPTFETSAPAAQTR